MLVRLALAAAMLQQPSPVRWDTDPRAPGVQVYTPDSDGKGPLICDLKLPFRHCWGPGEKPPPGAGAPFPPSAVAAYPPPRTLTEARR
jgi:hypothetical protein